MIRRCQVFVCALLLAAICGCVSKRDDTPRQTATNNSATARGREFLVSLYDKQLNLLPEFPGANVYWLFHDNYLAAKILADTNPDISHSIMAAIHHEGVRRSGKIEIVFDEASLPLPFRQYELLDVRRVGDKVIRTEKVRYQALEGWEDYADLLLLASIAERGSPAARRHWSAASKMWDGHGFLDAAAKDSRRYATYKLGLALLAASRLSPRPELPPGLFERLRALQSSDGGWVTDYDTQGKPMGFANVETTCLCIRGLEAYGYSERK